MGPLDEAYLRWLYSTVASDRYRIKAKTYWALMAQLYRKPFVWLVSNDDNRCADGLELRAQWISQLPPDQHPDHDWFGYECSFLEMLVALADRLAFEEEGDRSFWFWHLLDNLGLSNINDAVYDSHYEEEIEETLERVIWRTYQPNGYGGLFPLGLAEEDQRHVEIWYQLNAYLMERD